MAPACADADRLAPSPAPLEPVGSAGASPAATDLAAGARPEEGPPHAEGEFHGEQASGAVTRPSIAGSRPTPTGPTEGAVDSNLGTPGSWGGSAETAEVEEGGRAAMVSGSEAEDLGLGGAAPHPDAGARPGAGMPSDSEPTSVSAAEPSADGSTHAVAPTSVGEASTPLQGTVPWGNAPPGAAGPEAAADPTVDGAGVSAAEARTNTPPADETTAPIAEGSTSSAATLLGNHPADLPSPLPSRDAQGSIPILGGVVRARDMAKGHTGSVRVVRGVPAAAPDPPPAPPAAAQATDTAHT
jgi:hypothetical protein